MDECEACGSALTLSGLCPRCGIEPDEPEDVGDEDEPSEGA